MISDAANDKSIQRRLPRDSFYIKGTEAIDLIKEYEMWQAGAT